MDIETRRIVIDAMIGNPPDRIREDFLDAYAIWRGSGQAQNGEPLDLLNDAAGRRLRAIFDPSNPDSRLANARMRAVTATFDDLAGLIGGYDQRKRRQLDPQALVNQVYVMQAHRTQEYLVLDGMVSGQPIPRNRTPVLAGASDGYAC